MARNSGISRHIAFSPREALLLAIVVVPLLLGTLLRVDGQALLLLPLGVAPVLAALLLRRLLRGRRAVQSQVGVSPFAAPDEEVRIASFGSYAEAGPTAELLRAAGVPSVLVPLVSGTDPFGAAEVQELRVRGRDVGRARELLGLISGSRH